MNLIFSEFLVESTEHNNEIQKNDFSILSDLTEFSVNV